LKVNKFIVEYVQDAYLWTAMTNWKTVEPKNESDSYKFFDKLMNRTDDQWSMLTDDIDDLMSQVENEGKTYGYKLALYYFENSPHELFAVIRFVYPNTPAEKAGLKRGDALTSINGNTITEANYSELANSSDIRLGIGRFSVEGEKLKLTADVSFVTLSSQAMYSDPVVAYHVIEKGSHKIGYLCYTDFTDESEKKLLNIFADFKVKGVTDVVLDLRYNGGGSARMACKLSSMLAPASVVKGKQVYLSRIWNDDYMAYWEKKDKSQIYEYFTDTLPVNLDMNRLFVLTTQNTASASESTTIGLKAYINITQIGDTTHGKYCGGYLLPADDKTISNWGMYLMVYRFANKNGVSPAGGLKPDIVVKEGVYPLYPLGDERDPFIARAIEKITGVSSAQTRSDNLSSPYREADALKLRRPLEGEMIETGTLFKLRIEN
ncbi:MAG: PDZ domain-containing protein, partial [Tannerella sp.]|jgi:C-terminal processing protease CtpA/Prc|nr:PDZ domain-containing protein [Tannerella sp.]